MSSIQVLSLVVFAAVLGVSVWRRINVGVVAFAAAYLVAGIGGVSTKSVLSAFPGKLVVLVIGVTLLFSHAQHSGGISWVTESVVRLAGPRRWLIPWVGFVLAAILGTIGGLPAAVVAIVMPIVASLATTYRLNYFMMAVIANWAAIAAGMSPLSPSGALLRTLAAHAHVSYSPWALYGIVMSLFTVFCLVFYFSLGAARLAVPAGQSRAEDVVSPVELSMPGSRPAPEPRPNPSGMLTAARPRATLWGPAPNTSASGQAGGSYQVASLIALAVLAVLAVGFQLNIGLTALVLAFVLQVVFRPPEKEIIAGVAWSVVLLLAGLLIYLSLLSKLGTLVAIKHGLHGIGAPVLTLLALAYITGLLSNVDSSTVVVLGVMAPIGISLTNGSLAQVVAVLVVVASSVAVISMSPVHIDGSLIIANTPNDDEPRLFRRLILLAMVVTVIVPGVLSVYPILVGA